MSGWTHGKAVVDGVVQYLSVSAIQAADSSRNNGCLRWWFYRYIYGIKEPSSKALERGIKGHAEIEHYLKTQDRAGLSSLVLAGFHLLPTPGAGIAVEHSLVPLGDDGQEDLARAPLTAAGIPMVGKIDVLNWRGINYGGTDVTDTHDPPNTIECGDHKFVGKIENAKTGPQLVDEIQMAGYGEYAFRMAPTLERVRLSHNYFPERGNPRKSTIVVDREKLQPAWKRAEAIAVSIRDAARETNPDRVDANTRACHRYGRDCPARSVCTAGMHNSLSELIGTTAAERSLTSIHLPVLGQQADHLPLTTLSGLPPMQPAPGSLFAQLQAAQAAQAPAAAALPPLAAMSPAAPIAQPQQPPAQSDVIAEMARLQALEAATAPPAPAPAQVNPLAAVIAEIEQIAPHYGIGSPAFAGMAAVLVAQAKGNPLSPGAGLAGTAGQLSQFTVSEPAQIQQVLDQMRVMYARGAQAAQATPATAPAPTTDQVIASVTNGMAAVLADATVVAEKKNKGGRPKKQKSEDSTPAAATAPSPASTASSEEIVALTAEVATLKEALAAARSQLDVSQSMIANVARAATPSASAPTAYTIYVDTIVDGGDVKPLWPYVERVLAEMNRLSGKADFRNVGKDSDFSYNGWAGILTAFLNDLVSRGQIPPGDYLLDSSSGPISAVVLEAMRGIAHRTGGKIVRGR